MENKKLEENALLAKAEKIKPIDDGWFDSDSKAVFYSMTFFYGFTAKFIKRMLKKQNFRVIIDYNSEKKKTKIRFIDDIKEK